MNHGYKTIKQALETNSAASRGVLYPPLCGIVQLANSATLCFRNWSFTNQLQHGRRIPFLKFRISSRIILILTGLLLISVVVPACASLRLDETALEPISGIVSQAVNDGQIPGAVVLIGSGDRVVFRRAFG
jgi:hypothetical protein